MAQVRGWLCAGLVLIAAGPAWGQDVFKRTRDLFDEHRFAVHAGGGFASFTQDGTGPVAGPGASWTVRGSWGLARMVGAEVAYLGGAFPLDVTAMNDAGVVETGLEAVMRVGYPLLPTVNSFLTPYLAGGLGWSSFNLIGADAGNPGNIANSDQVMSVPLGFGLAGGYRRWSLDVRWIHRTAFDDDMFRAASASAGQNTAGISGTLGYRF
jgi:hypothetical protein